MAAMTRERVAAQVAWARVAGRRIGLEMRVLVERDRRRRLRELQRAVADDRKAAKARRAYSARSYPL